MKLLITIFFSFIVAGGIAQPDVEKLTNTLKEFHQALVKKNTVSISRQTDEALSYGHSNGLVETKTGMLKNLDTGFISYQYFKEDSLSVIISDNIANARFTAEVSATLNGKRSNMHLKVLEVWVKRGNRWLLFARQAVKS